MSDTAVLPAMTAERLVDRDDLVDQELPNEDRPVPNYFLDTKIFNKMGRNAVVEAQPSVIHFAGFTPHQVHVRKVKFANVSTEVTRFHILPPETPYFKLTYTKRDRLVPGFAVECVLEFKPDEVRYYYDALRVHSKDSSNNLIIPIHAYPILGNNDFPQQIKFAPIPVGCRKTKVIPLRSRASVEFEFEIKILQPNPVFTVEPLEGLIPANGETDVAITFSPNDFVTAEMTLELRVSQFNFTPLRCHVMGNSSPGMQRQQVMQQFGLTDDDCADPGLLQQLQLLPPADPGSFSPLERARRKKRKQQQQASADTSAAAAAAAADGGYKLPQQLNCPHSVAQILNQREGKLNMRDLREALHQQSSGLTASRQMKEAVFEQEVSRCVYEERQNQLRWQVRVGDAPPSEEEIENLLLLRQLADKYYRRKRGDPEKSEELERTQTETVMRRTRRTAWQVPDCSADFDLYRNDTWESRWTARFRFMQAAWKVIVRRRADEKLTGLRQLFIDWGKGKYAAVTTSFLPFMMDKEKMEEEDELAEDLLKETQLSPDEIGTVRFPTHQSAQQIKKMEEAAPPTFPSLGDRLLTRRAFQFEQLHVALHYQLQHYERVDVHSLSKGHVPLRAARELRQGGTDEIIDLPAVSVADPEAGELRQLGEVEQESILAEVPLLLKPPPALLQPPSFHPLHVFNPAPGLHIFDSPPSFLETDPDSRLCPLPRYAQFAPLDRRDVVRGVTVWKRFASAGLAALGNTPTLTRVWVPRWSDPFASELAPAEVPKFLDGLDEEDRAHVVDPGEGDDEEEEEDGEETLLTPEMVFEEFLRQDEPAANEEAAGGRAAAAAAAAEVEEFPLGQKMPDSNVPLAADGLAPRWERERQLELFLVNRANQMGKRAEERQLRLNSLLSDASLALR